MVIVMYLTGGMTARLRVLSMEYLLAVPTATSFTK